MGNTNPFEKIMPAEQPREQEIITPKPEKRPYNPALVDDLIRKIDGDEQDEEERVREIERREIKPTLQ